MSNFLGSGWSLWPAGTSQGLNLLQSDRLVASRIISVFLIRPGEIPHNPDFGFAPELFEPLSNYNPGVWTYDATQQVNRWVKDLSYLDIQVQPLPDPYNRLEAVITYATKQQPDLQLLTFDFVTFTGAIASGNLDSFIQSITLNGQPFAGIPTRR